MIADVFAVVLMYVGGITLGVMIDDFVRNR